MPAATPRYHIERATTSGPFVIYDNVLDGFCTLKDAHDNLLPLEWSSPSGAEAWLYRCAQLWSQGRVPAPKGWSTWRAPTQSPWASTPSVVCGVCDTLTFEFRPKQHNNHWVNACPRCQ